MAREGEGLELADLELELELPPRAGAPARRGGAPAGRAGARLGGAGSAGAGWRGGERAGHLRLPVARSWFPLWRRADF